MTSQHLVLVCFVSLVILFSVLLAKRVYWHPLSKFPGPVLPATTSFYQFYMLWKGREGQWYRDLHERYGPVVRCGPNHLSFNDPDMVPIVYHRKADKTDFHQEFSCPAAVFNQKSHVDHAKAKRRFGHAFSLTQVQQYEGTLDDQVVKWMSILGEEASSNSLVDWETWARYFSFDAITAVSFGEPFGFMAAKEDVGGLIENMDNAMYLQKMSLYPKVSSFARNTFLGRWLFVARTTDRVGLGIFMAEIQRLVKSHLESMTYEKKSFNQNSMLDQWLSGNKSDGDAGSVADIEDQLLMDMMAGPDSISLMTTNLTFLMAAHPHILKRTQMEIDEAYKNQEIATPSPTYEECLRLPLVNACVREGLRFVASTFPRRRWSPPGNAFELAGRYVPPGTSVAASACEIGRNRTLYGSNADEFDPDRWLKASEEDLRRWDTLDVHWGFGVRRCLGRHIGAMVLYKSLVLLLHRFDLSLEDTTKINLWSYPSSYNIRMVPRIAPSIS